MLWYIFLMTMGIKVYSLLWVMQVVKISPQGPICLDSSLGSEASEAASAKAMAIPSGFMSLGA